MTPSSSTRRRPSDCSTSMRSWRQTTSSSPCWRTSSFHGLKLLFETVQSLEEDLAHVLDHVFIVVNAFNQTFKLAKEALEALRTHYPEYMLTAMVRQCTKFAQSSSEGVPVFLADRDSKGATDIDTMVTEVLARIEAAHTTHRRRRPGRAEGRGEVHGMKKAFEQNVSRSRPRLKLGSLVEESTAPDAAEPEATEPSLPPPPVAHGAEGPSSSARPLAPTVPRAPVPTPLPEVEAPRPGAPSGRRGAEAVAEMLARHAAAPAPTRSATPPASRTAPSVPAEESPSARREKLRQRLKAARETPRPAPLPATAAAAGVLAVERIAALQSELAEAKALNLGLAQELDGARRQAERATEEARLRVDEARRLASAVEGRTKLLADLEKELSALEGERDEMLLAVQDLRAREAANAEEQQRVEAELAEKDKQISDGLAEEERMATEVESYREELDASRRVVNALTTEREMLARQVAELTTERQELLEARKALEAVHRALTEASVR